MQQVSDQVSRASVRRGMQDDALSVFKSLLLVGITTIALLILDHFFLRHLILIYLVPVVIAATNWGLVAAVIAAIASDQPRAGQ